MEMIIVKDLPDPRPFSHSHACMTNGLVTTSGMVSAKDANNMNMNVGVSFCSSTNSYSHNIAEQMNDIIKQLYAIGAHLGMCDQELVDNLVEVRVYLVDVRRHFKEFNLAYGDWIKRSTHLPARTTIGVEALPSNVALEMSFIFKATA